MALTVAGCAMSDVSYIGLARTYHDNGIVNEEYFIAAGQQEGIYRSYHNNGALHVIGNYVNGVLDGPRRMYTRYGYLYFSASYVRGDMQGELCTYFENTTQCRHRCYYLDDELDGVATHYTQQGQLKKVVHYKRGIRHGIYIRYNGPHIVEYNHFENGDYHGECRNYYDTGELRNVINYHLGKLHGVSRYYGIDGKLHSTYHFEHNERVGEAIEYDFDTGTYNHFNMNDITAGDALYRRV